MEYIHIKEKYKMKIYGWQQLNKDCTLLEVDMTDKELKKTFKIKDKITSELQFKRVIEQAYQEGRWFKNKNEAKKAMMNTLLEEIQWRERIIKKLQQL